MIFSSQVGYSPRDTLASTPRGLKTACVVVASAAGGSVGLMKRAPRFAPRRPPTFAGLFCALYSPLLLGRELFNRHDRRERRRDSTQREEHCDVRLIVRDAD